MGSQTIYAEAIGRAQQLGRKCHPALAEMLAGEYARYARLACACDSLESFDGFRPQEDDDLFYQLADRRRAIADVLANANLDAYEQDAEPGIYLAIPYFPRCTDKQPVWLVNRTTQRITYVRRCLNAWATADDGIDEYHDAGSAFEDGIAAEAVIEPGQKVQIDTYSMRVDGDFVSNRKVVLLMDGQRQEGACYISKLAGYLWDEHLHGFHRLEMDNS